MSEWISVKDRIPELAPYGYDGYEILESAPVLAINKNRDMRVAVCEIDGNRVYWKSLQGDICVTHWMPLPEPPEE